jgi:hypothetical protein
MFNMIGNYLHRQMPLPPPPEIDTIEVMNAWGKIDRILDSAYMDTHVETAQRLFNNMLKSFNFTPEQRQSPLTLGMQAKINLRRGQAIAIRK